MHKILTIIVPTYNMEAYIDKCLTSLIIGAPGSELMQSLEVLVINDGSTDRTSEIAHGYESRYPETFKVIDKDNGNYGSCINVALPIATGKYVRVLDADDWFDKGSFVKFMKAIKDIDVDMIYDKAVTENMKGEKIKEQNLRIPSFKVLHLKKNKSIYCKLWSHGITYKRNIFDGLGYQQTEGIYYTDMEWIYLPMSRVNTFMYLPISLYCYLEGRPGQSMEPSIFKSNYDMQLKVSMSYINIYQSCLHDGGRRNGVEINMDYLRTRCLARIEEEYFNLISKPNDKESQRLLIEFDKLIHTQYPEFHKELETAVHPNNSFPLLPFPLHIIHSWRHHGAKLTALQVWIINRYLGLSVRIARLLKAFG